MALAGLVGHAVAVVVDAVAGLDGEGVALGVVIGAVSFAVGVAVAVGVVGFAGRGIAVVVDAIAAELDCAGVAAVVSRQYPLEIVELFQAAF